MVIWDQWEVHILGKRLQFVYDYYTNVSAHLDAFSVSIVDQNSDIPSMSPMANNTIIQGSIGGIGSVACVCLWIHVTH